MARVPLREGKMRGERGLPGHISDLRTDVPSSQHRYRLLPGSVQPEPLNTFHDGSFIGAEATSERWEAWPNAHDVSFTFLLNEVARRGGKPYTRCSFCADVAYAFCDECSRAVCVMHCRQYDGNDKPLCPDHFNASLNDRKKRQRLAQIRSIFPESSL